MHSYNNWQIDEHGFHLSESSVDKSIISQLLSTIEMEHEDVLHDATSGYCLPHDVVASLSREELEALDMPSAYPYYFDIKTNQELTSDELRFNLKFFWYSQNLIVNPVITGCYIYISCEESYVLIKDQYALVKGINEFNAVPSSEKSIAGNYRELARIQGLSKNTRTALEKLCRETKVIEPRKLSVRIEKLDDGSIKIAPQVVTDEDGQTINDTFTKNFGRLRTINNAMIAGDNTYLLFDEKQKEGLNKLKRENVLKGEKKESFIKAPEILLDADVFDLDNFSDRVKEIGEYKPRVFPFIKPYKEDWLVDECELGICVDDEIFTLPEEELSQAIFKLEKAIEDKAPSVKTESGRDIAATPETLEALKTLHKAVQEHQISTGSGAASLGRARNIDKRILVIYDNIVQKTYDPTSTEAERAGYGTPKSLKATLLPHQEEGFKRLIDAWQRRHKGMLLADDMGLGKTLQGLTFIAALKEQAKAEPQNSNRFLIVAPVALLDNWQDEYVKFFNTEIFGQPVTLHGGSLKYYVDQNGNFDLSDLPEDCLALTTYETLRDKQLVFGRIDWRVIILDEAQKIKTPSARMTYAAKAMKYDFGLCMTGTPVENSWVDLWSILDFAMPGTLGSLQEFNREYQKPLSDSTTDVSELGKRLQSEVSPYMLRRLKADVAKDLPNKHIHPVKVQMSDEQLYSYTMAISNARSEIKYLSQVEIKPHVLKTILALRDISLHKDGANLSLNAIGTMSAQEIIDGSARLKETINILQGVRDKDEKAIIFLLSRKFQVVLMKVIQEIFGIEAFGPVNGSVSGSKRLKTVNDFQSKPGFQVLVLSPEAAGVGLNIVAANHVIHLSRLWNPAKEDQATDRAYRIGSKKDVHVYYPMAVHPQLGEGGSFDEKLDRLLNSKRRLSDEIMLPQNTDEEIGAELGKGLFDGPELDNSNIVAPSSLSVDDVDKLEAIAFERLVCCIFRKKGAKATTTPIVNDYGADVVIEPADEDCGLIIQCKHRDDPMKMEGCEGVQQVIAAAGSYSYWEGVKYRGMVATNAMGFTENARQVAHANNIELAPRKTLQEWLAKTPVSSAELMDGKFDGKTDL